MPKVSHLFEECEWRPFISHESPKEDTWDGEDRHSAIEYGTPEHVSSTNVLEMKK